MTERSTIKWWTSLFSVGTFSAVVWMAGLLGAFLFCAGGFSCLAEVSAHSIHPPEVVASFAASDSTQANMVKPVLLADGRLLGLSVSVDRPQEMLGRYSSDDGATWGSPVRLFTLPEHVGAFGYFDAFTDRDGKVHIFFLNDGNNGGVLPKLANEPQVRPSRVLDIWQVMSDAKASTWGEAARIWSGSAGDLLSCIQLKSGRILLPISYKTSRSWRNRGEGFKEFTYFGSYSSSAIYSDDGGKTWKQSPDELSIPTPDLSAIGGVEPSVIELKDGRVWMLIRTQMGRFYESYSRDGGIHWSAPTPSSIIASESPAALVRLNDGRILLLWNECLRYPYAYGGRHVLHGAVSSDEGRTWTGYREVVRDPLRKDPPPSDSDWGAAYPFPVVARNGDVVLSTWVETGKARVMYRLDPRWLEETSQHSDFQEGADHWSIFGVRGVETLAVPGQPSKRALAIRRASNDWPSGAVWNFPSGNQGTLRLRLMIENDFQGDNIGLTDHYSVPFDGEDVFYNVFNIRIEAGGKLLNASLAPGRHEILLSWNTVQGVCDVKVDGKSVGEVKAQRVSEGIHYLRFHPAGKTGNGLLLESVDADVSQRSPSR